jgi:hypothetical protein
VRAVTHGTRARLLTGAAVAAAVLVLAQALWPVLGPLTQRTPLSPAVTSTDAGVPVPASATRCAAVGPTVADVTAGDSGRWCVPDGVSVATLTGWYDDVLPPGRDAGRLRWCVEQRLDDGSRRALWSTGTGLVGYVLPPEGPRFGAHGTARAAGVRAVDDVEAVGVEVVVLAGSACHPVARASREQQ